jgi:hypothetical protein
MAAKRAFVAPSKTESVDKKKKPERRIVTMSEWGKKLPIGIVELDGRLNKDFNTRPWKTKDERALGKLKKPDITMGRYIASVIAHMCDSIGSVNLSAIAKHEEKLVHIQRMYTGDVFYVYCWLRREALGSKINLSFTCPTCQKRLPWTGDMETIQVGVVDHIEALRWIYKLMDPIQLRGKEVKSLQMSSPRWLSIDQATGSRDDANAKVTAIRGSIVSLNDDDDAIALGESELDELTKRDFEALVSEIDERYTGPNMALEGVCTPEMCPMGGGYEFRVPIDWSYDNFFKHSSK